MFVSPEVQADGPHDKKPRALEGAGFEDPAISDRRSLKTRAFVPFLEARR